MGANMPRGVYTRALAKKNPFLPKSADLGRSYTYYHQQFTDGMETLLAVVNKIAFAKTKMDAITNLVEEAKQVAKEDKFKNRHQIQKLCPHCGEPKDPRGWSKHVQKCAKGKKMLGAGNSK